MKKGRLLLGLGALCLVTFSAVSCGPKSPDVPGGGDIPTPTPGGDEKKVTSFEVTTSNKDNTFYIAKGKSASGEKGSFFINNIEPATAAADAKFDYSSDNTDVLKVGVNGQFEVYKTGAAKVTVVARNNPSVKREIVVNVVNSEKSIGGHNYQALDVEERAKITGKLEGWAMDNHLTGITLFQNGGYILYSDRLTLGTEEYIPGFGYGNLSNGKINGDYETIDSTTNSDYKKYYHQVLSTAPADINYLDSQGQVVGDLYGYISAGLWNTKMNAAGNGYDWYNCLAKSEPIPMDEDPTTKLATKFQVKVKTGKDGLVYRTLGKRKQFDKREVVIDDYINAYIQLLSQSNNLSRGAELTNINSDGTLLNANAYYNLSARKVDKELFEKLEVGIKKIDDETLEFKLAKPTTKFFAMYSLSSSLTQPIPQDFVDDIGGMKNFGKKSTDGSSSVIDNILCLGPYMLEEWNNKATGGVITFKRNDLFIDSLNKEDPTISGRYQIPGIHAYVSEGIKENQLLQYFLDKKIDAAPIPQQLIDQYKTDPRCRQTQGDSTFKLNVNSSTQEEWNQHYEEIWKHKPNKGTHKVKPIMSNDHFLKGLNESINRKEFAEKIGAVPSQNYFGSSYLYDPINGKSYNDSIYHQENLATRFPETYGYNYDQAVYDFGLAVKECVAAGAFNLGTPSNPTKLTIDVNWMGTEDTELYGLKLAGYIEKAFNDPEVCGKKVVLKVNNIDGTTNYEDVYNQHLQVGRFDLGFGSISGNSLNPLSFLEVLKSDNSSGFTLNWGKSTAEVDDSLYYDGKSWSFDALWQAANSGVVVGSDQKVVKEPIQISDSSTIKFNQADKSYDVVLKWNVNNVLAGHKDLVSIKEGAPVSISAKIEVGDKQFEYVSRLIDKGITYGENTISFKIPYDNSDKVGSDRLINARKVTFQVSYNITIDGSLTSNFINKELVKHS